jgi:hypothetical protein
MRLFVQIQTCKKIIIPLIDYDIFCSNLWNGESLFGKTDPELGKLPIELIHSNVNGGTSNVNGGTSNINGGTSNVNGGTSNVNGGTSNVNGSTSNVNGGTFNVEVPPFNVKVPPFMLRFSELGVILKNITSVLFDV